MCAPCTLRSCCTTEVRGTWKTFSYRARNPERAPRLTRTDAARLVHHPPAIHVESLAGHSVAQFRTQEEADARNIERHNAALQTLRGHHGASLFVGHHFGLRLGLDRARRDAVDVDIVGTHFTRQR